MSTIPELRPREFTERWPALPSESVTLLDVREPHERALAAVAGTLNIPMGEVPGRIDELHRDRPTVVMCRSGGRSLRVAEFLSSRGFSDVYNLAGGINAWSEEVDQTIPRY